jgi:IS6 family transposase
VDHVSLYRWVQHFTPLAIDAARPCRHAVGGRWFVDETYVKVGGVWRYVYRAVDQHGQVIDVYVSARRDIAAARRFFTAVLDTHGAPEEVVTDLARALDNVIEEVLPAAFHDTAQYANNRVECDHGRLKAQAAAESPGRGSHSPARSPAGGRSSGAVPRGESGHHRCTLYARRTVRSLLRGSSDSGRAMTMSPQADVAHRGVIRTGSWSAVTAITSPGVQ